jgi:aminopeptidase N
MSVRLHRVVVALALVFVLPAAASERRDPHSFSRPDQVVVTHLELDLQVDFAARQLAGTATLRLDRRDPRACELILDSRDLTIEAVTLDGTERGARFTIADDVPIFGRALTVRLEPTTRSVTVRYRTSPHAGALQWLDPAQTAGGAKPYLFTQSQAILARTWIPCQDTPGVRCTYTARIRTRSDLMAVMSAANPQARRDDGVYEFEMRQPVPSYLMALAVGDLEFRALDRRCGIYSEPSVIEPAAWEFAEVPQMLAAAEELYGPYRWERYDLLVLPPSFPFGGMENPRLTFATPTVLAGDRSLVTIAAHELAHSWSGNLVTNATWNDFWLNEGFTNYFENRIMQKVAGEELAAMIAQLDVQSLQRSLADSTLAPRDTWLFLDLGERDPDAGVTDIAYNKGYLFLRHIEDVVGRARWDEFLRGYFDRHAFGSITTREFVAELERELIRGDQAVAARIGADRWIYGPGLPEDAPRIGSMEFARVRAQVEAWQSGVPARKLDTGGWRTQHWLYFLDQVPDSLAIERLADLDTAFDLTGRENSEILCAWLQHAIRSGYAPANPAVESFLTRQGRRKYLEPLYRALARTPAGMERARAIYTRARPTYHPVSYTTIDAILGAP